MNKTEKIICLLLGGVLAWYIFTQKNSAPTAAEPENAPEAAIQQEATPAPAPTEPAAPVAEAPKKVVPSIPEEIAVLENDSVKLELTSWGAAVKRITLKDYAANEGKVSEENPAVVLDYSDSPMGAGETIEAFKLVDKTDTSVTFVDGAKKRVIALKDNYRIEFTDEGIGGSVSVGSMKMGFSKNDLLSVDSWAMDAGKGKEGVIHHSDDDSPLKAYLVGGLTGGCSGSKSAEGMSERTLVPFPGAQKWVALKNRFFVTAFVEGNQPNAGFESTIVRDTQSAAYRPYSIEARIKFVGDAAKRTFTFYAGPKKQALLWDLGMKDVMEFGMWRWLCYPLVWVLNFFNDLIPNYGIAIILLTILVRILFWPLTHKSTVGMKKMQEIQPKMKELQAKFKDNPQRLQQETWALYRAEKVNPMSSCLPMLIQIPVFIALFNVLRSAVELRYAPFLWIGDLSEPEALFASWFPFGGLNILPILMAVTTALQSAFTPSAGDKSQQKMMMVFMPIMMLVMFYSFPSALSLYWFLSNLFSIAQMAIIRRQTKK